MRARNADAHKGMCMGALACLRAEKKVIFAFIFPHSQKVTPLRYERRTDHIWPGAGPYTRQAGFRPTGGKGVGGARGAVRGAARRVSGRSRAVPAVGGENRFSEPARFLHRQLAQFT